MIWSLVINLIRGIKNSMFTTLAFVFILYGCVELLNLNGGIAVLTFGILLGNIDLFGEGTRFRNTFKLDACGFNPNEKDFFSEIVFIMQTYFFVYVGISIQFGSLGAYSTGLLIVLLIILMRIPVISLLIRKHVTVHEKAVMTVMSPKGLVPAVLASLPLQRGYAGGEIILNLGYSIVLFSIVISSLLVIIIGLKPDLLKRFIADNNSAPAGENTPPSPEIVIATEDSVSPLYPEE
jgi:NhaP-type Na+/H+ or K+/H+ antiporter